MTSYATVPCIRTGNQEIGIEYFMLPVNMTLGWIRNKQQPYTVCLMAIAILSIPGMLLIAWCCESLTHTRRVSTLRHPLM